MGRMKKGPAKDLSNRSHEKKTVRVWGLGYVTPRTAVILVIITAVLIFLVFKLHV